MLNECNIPACYIASLFISSQFMESHGMAWHGIARHNIVWHLVAYHEFELHETGWNGFSFWLSCSFSSFSFCVENFFAWNVFNVVGIHSKSWYFWAFGYIHHTYITIKVGKKCAMSYFRRKPLNFSICIYWLRTSGTVTDFCQTNSLNKYEKKN